MKIITVASLKGGVGKTTISVFLSQTLAANGSRVLFVDLDPNNNGTDFFLSAAPPENLERRNVEHVLTKRAGVADCIYPAAGLSVLPSTLALCRVAADLASNPGLILRFRAELKRLPFDFVVIDTPPSLDSFLRTGLYAADMVLTPVSTARWVMQAVEIIRDEVETVAENTDTPPTLHGVLSMVTGKQAETAPAEVAGVPLLRSAIIRKASLQSLADAGKALKLDSAAGEIFAALAAEVAA